jgi:hypothetical protein
MKPCNLCINKFGYPLCDDFGNCSFGDVPGKSPIESLSEILFSIPRQNEDEKLSREELKIVI